MTGDEVAKELGAERMTPAQAAAFATRMHGGVLVSPGTDSKPGHKPNFRAYVTACRHVETFCTDLYALMRSNGNTFPVAWCATKEQQQEGDRWKFWIVSNGRRASLWMPGYSLSELRFMGEPGQNQYDFYRLYIGRECSSWLWKFALNVLEPHFTRT